MATQTFDFDEIIDRRSTDSGKWNQFDPDVIPMPVADMDFRSPQPVIDALQARAQHGVFGYGYSPWRRWPDELIETLQVRYRTRMGLALAYEDINFTPNVISVLYGLSKIVVKPDENVLLTLPIYWPFVSAAKRAPREIVNVHMVSTKKADGTLYYEIDFDAFEAAITPQTRLFILSNPHNPVGRVYTRDELEKMAEICLRHNIVICSDEIHGELCYDQRQHIPFPSLSPEVAQQTIIATAASKAFNLPGIALGITISKNHGLLAQVQDHVLSMGLGGINVMSSTAVLAAFQHGQPWLDALLPYLQANRDFAVNYIRQHLPDILPTNPEATILMLLDCRGLRLDEEPADFFLREARVALSGNFESQGYSGFARLNFGCPRAQLAEALDRMRQAVNKL